MTNVTVLSLLQYMCVCFIHNFKRGILSWVAVVKFLKKWVAMVKFLKN